jgi:hypothetical protein
LTIAAVIVVIVSVLYLPVDIAAQHCCFAAIRHQDIFIEWKLVAG